MTEFISGNTEYTQSIVPQIDQVLAKARELQYETTTSGFGRLEQLRALADNTFNSGRYEDTPIYVMFDTNSGVMRVDETDTPVFEGSRRIRYGSLGRCLIRELESDGSIQQLVVSVHLHYDDLLESQSTDAFYIELATADVDELRVGDGAGPGLVEMGRVMNDIIDTAERDRDVQRNLFLAAGDVYEWIEMSVSDDSQASTIGSLIRSITDNAAAQKKITTEEYIDHQLTGFNLFVSNPVAGQIFWVEASEPVPFEDIRSVGSKDTVAGLYTEWLNPGASLQVYAIDACRDEEQYITGYYLYVITNDGLILRHFVGYGTDNIELTVTPEDQYEPDDYPED